MEIHQIQEYLSSANSQDRLKAIAALREHDTTVAVPLLTSRITDQEFLVRSCVAMGLGKKRNANSYAALLQLTNFDSDPNVRAEAANSLSLYGEVAISHLVQMFKKDSHWLVRRSIIAALVEMKCPEELLEISTLGVASNDEGVVEACLDVLGMLARSTVEEQALEVLLPHAQSGYWRVRAKVARSLPKFENVKAKEKVLSLRDDSDYRVVAAVLENSL